MVNKDKIVYGGLTPLCLALVVDRQGLQPLRLALVVDRQRLHKCHPRHSWS